MALQRMHNVLIVVDDLDAVKGFFLALGLEGIIARSDTARSHLVELPATNDYPSSRRVPRVDTLNKRLIPLYEGRHL